MSDIRRSATIDKKLLDLLVCPLTKGALTLDEEKNELVSKLAGVAYPVRDGIPIMLPSEARPLDDDGSAIAGKSAGKPR